MTLVERAKMLSHKLTLAKTHDYCPSKNPKLTVVFLHGIASSSATYEATLKHLESMSSLKDVRFITFDLLGAGKSMKSDELKYDFEEQLEALDNSIDLAKVDTPLVLVGHSMGTLIATRYADSHRRQVVKLILISPPIYREEDVKNPMFATAIDGFREVVARKNRAMLEDKAFNRELRYIVSNPANYNYLAGITKPTYLIYGELDSIIASFNIPKLVKLNPNIKAIRTPGTHGITHDKYNKMVQLLEESLNETI